MKAYCPYSCEVCRFQRRVKLEPRNPRQRRHWNSTTIVNGYGSALGEPQIPIEGIAEQEIVQAVEEASYYMQETVMQDDRYLAVRDRCRNLDRHCAAWALDGECDSNHAFMSINCGPVCFSCEYLHTTALCPVDMNQRHAWYPGDLDRMFARIVEEYPATVLSQPPSGPWVVTIDDFLTAEECQALVAAGQSIGYERSTAVGDELDSGETEDYTTAARTSTQAWCHVENCESQPVINGVVKRLEALTGIQRSHAEWMQLLRYIPGQRYTAHNDYLEVDRWRAIGARILTVYLYLNDDDLEGGETAFPDLHVKVSPKRGRILLWPSVPDANPHVEDERTLHEALPVIRGTKYGANVWFHQRQFRVAYENGC